jgi:RNA polymerase sigma-70 factor (ECF subfamily)
MEETMNALVARAQCGEAPAREELLLTVRRAVMRYLLAQHCRPSDAEDIAQDVCIAVLHMLPRWRDTGRTMWGAVFTITRNKLADTGRHRRRRPGDAATTLNAAELLEVRDASTLPEEIVLRRDATERIGRLLDKLPRSQRDVLVLRAIVGLTVAETAQALGFAHGSIHVLQHRATKKLRALIEADGGVSSS